MVIDRAEADHGAPVKPNERPSPCYGERSVIEAITVIRVAGPGEHVPYVLVAVRNSGQLTCGRLQSETGHLPAVGTPVEVVETHSGPRTYRLVPRTG